MYESVLQSSFLVRLLATVIPALLIVLVGAQLGRKNSVSDEGDAVVMTAAMRFVGAAFIFIGSFANVTAWQGASAANASLKRELASLSTLAESILDYQTAPVLENAVSKIVTYIETVRDLEMSDVDADGNGAVADGLERKQRTKNFALAGKVEVMDDSAEQKALDIRSAIILIEEANIVTERDLNRMLDQVDEFQAARRERLSTTWPLVPGVVISTFGVITLASLLLIGRFPGGSNKSLKRMQVIGSVAVVSAVWFSVLSTQDVSIKNSRFSAPIEAFVSRYGG